MKAEESIRINVTIHPDKDPVLFSLLSAINKEARTRRLLNLATNGIGLEKLGMSSGNPFVQQRGELIQSLNIGSSHEVNSANNNLESSGSDKKTFKVDQEELDTIGDIFGNS